MTGDILITVTMTVSEASYIKDLCEREINNAGEEPDMIEEFNAFTDLFNTLNEQLECL